MIAATFPPGTRCSECPTTRTSGLSLCVLVFVCALDSCLAADRILFDRPLTQPGSLDYNPSWHPKATGSSLRRNAAAGPICTAFIPTAQASNASPTTRQDLSSSPPAPMGGQTFGFWTRPPTKPRRSPPERAVISDLPGLPTAHGSLSARIAIATATFLPPKVDGNACIWCCPTMVFATPAKNAGWPIQAFFWLEWDPGT